MASTVGCEMNSYQCVKISMHFRVCKVICDGFVCTLQECCFEASDTKCAQYELCVHVLLYCIAI